MSARFGPSLALVVIVALAFGACASSGPSPTPGGATPGPDASPTAGPTSAPQTPGPTPTGAPPTPAPSPSPPSAALILRVTNEGGFIAPSAHLAEIPAVSFYDDGTIITPITPSTSDVPLVSAASIRDVGPAGAQAIVAAIRKAGLDKTSAKGPGGVPGDSGTTVFTVTLDGTTTTTRFGQLGGGPGGPGHPGASGTPDDQSAAALALLDRLTDTSDAWGGTPDQGHPYPATAYRIFAAPVGPSAGPGASPAPVAWPLDTPLASFGSPANPDRGITGLRAGVAFGADAEKLAPVLDTATQSTLFSSGGQDWALYVRPLLPDELAG